MSEHERVDYTDRGTALTGWLARPTGTPRGAFVVFPNIANFTPPAVHRAQMLADAGFVAMIADFYGEPAGTFEIAGPLAKELRRDVDHYRARLAAAVATLRAHPAAQGLDMAAIGYCMGGQAVLELARAGEDLALVVSFHGIFETDRKADGDALHKPRILICHGDADPLAPRESVISLWEEFDAAGYSWHFHSYSGVKHGFTDPGSDGRGMAAIGYDASADRQSWAALMSLADEVFG